MGEKQFDRNRFAWDLVVDESQKKAAVDEVDADFGDYRDVSHEVMELLLDAANSALLDAARERKRPAKKLTVNERMTLELSKDPQRIEWSKRAWATHLKCSETAVHKSPQWQTIMFLREQEKQSRQDQGESA